MILTPIPFEVIDFNAVRPAVRKLTDEECCPSCKRPFPDGDLCPPCEEEYEDARREAEADEIGHCAVCGDVFPDSVCPACEEAAEEAKRDAIGYCPSCGVLYPDGTCPECEDALEEALEKE